MFFAAAYFKLPQAFNGEAELAAILAAIFTVGSLIIALVAFVTQSNAEGVIKRAVTSAIEESTRKTDQRIQTFLRAYSAFQRAQTLYSSNVRLSLLQVIEDTCDDALTIEPSLYGVDRWLGNRFFGISRHLFLQSRHFVRSKETLEVSLQVPFAFKALKRLESAIAKGEAEATGETALQIAQLHALLGNAPSEIGKWMRLAKEGREAWSFDESEALTVLSTARNREQAQYILAEYSFDPMSRGAVKEYLYQQEPSVFVARLVAFANNVEALQYPPFNPTIVTFRLNGNHDGAFLEWEDAIRPSIGKRRGGIPRFPDFEESEGHQPNPLFEPIDALLVKCFADVTFVMPYYSD